MGDQESTNLDCSRCCYKTIINDGGDYEELTAYCTKYKIIVCYRTVNNKPCNLEPGSYYGAIEINNK